MNKKEKKYYKESFKKGVINLNVTALDTFSKLVSHKLQKHVWD
jgi:hypothetical protein